MSGEPKRSLDGRSMRVSERLNRYWRLEAANVVIVPVCALVIVFSLGGTLTAGLAISLTACASLLLCGAIYWRAWARRRTAQAHEFHSCIKRIIFIRDLSLVLVFVAFCLLCWEVGDGQLAVTSVVGWTVWSLAVLEYINYFHVQLQYFDSAAEFRRLRTLGPRRSHLARDIARHRPDR